MLYGFCSKFCTLSSSAKKFEHRLRFDYRQLKGGKFFWDTVYKSAVTLLYFSRWTWVSLVFSFHLFRREPLGDRWHTFLEAGCCSCYLTNSVKALKESQSTGCDQGKIIHWPYFFASSIRLPREGAFLPLHWLSMSVPFTKSEENSAWQKMCALAYITVQHIWLYFSKHHIL